MPKAVLYRMALPGYVCGYGTAARDLLKQKGFEIEEHILKSRSETDRFKEKHRVATTPLIFIDEVKIGGYTELRKLLKKKGGKKPFWRLK